VKIQTSKQAQPNRSRYWQAHVKALSESGLSRAEYCRQHQLSYHTFVYWQRKFAPKNPQGMKLVPVALPTVPGAMTGSRVDDVGMKILLPGDIAIAVADNFSPATLAKLLNTLEAR